jgi:DNA-binding response OmpR family regulator
MGHEDAVTAIESITLGKSSFATTPDPPPDWLVLAGASDRKVLVEVPSGHVIAVAAGSEFVRLLMELAPRLAVVSSPPAGSAELLAATAERRRRPGLRLVLLNQPSDVAGRLEALAQGFDEALPMSIDPEELTGRALHLLLDDDRRGLADPRPIEIAPGVHLDLLGRRVRRSGVEIHLRPREYALIAHLATHPGRVFTRRELVTRAWGAGYSGGSRTVDVHVRWLRAKIERDPARPAHLMTVRGVGYRPDPPEQPSGDLPALTRR